MGGWRGRRFDGGRASTRRRAFAISGLAALALGATGCGVEEHANDPRPQAPTRVSVTLNQDGVTVEPSRIAIGPNPNEQIPQNRNTDQPAVRSDAPLIVAFVASNLTDRDSRLELRGVGREATSKPWVGHGAVSMQASLPTGTYVLTAAGVPGAKPARLTVGPYRYSSENDLLLP